MTRIIFALIFSGLIFAANACLFAQGANQISENTFAEGFTGALTLDEKPAPQPLDESLFVYPQDATPAELFAFIDELPEKVSQPTSPEEMEKLIDITTRVYKEIAENILANSAATDEEKEQAAQLKMVALTAQARTNDAVKAELDAYLDTLIADAKNDDAKMKAYQFKIQSLMAEAQRDPSVMEKVSTIAEKILADEKGEELQILGLELTAQSLLAQMQTDPNAATKLLAFLEGFLSETHPAKALERAKEIKFVGLLLASEQDGAKKAEMETYFDELFAGPLSTEAKLRLAQLRVQSLMGPQSQADAEAPAKLAVLADRLMTDESDEIKELGFSVKAGSYIQAAQADPSKIDDLLKYADSVLATNPVDAVREKMAGLKIQGYMLKLQNGDESAEKELLAFLDKMIATNPAENFLDRLVSIKVQILAMQVQDDSSVVPALKGMLDQYGKNERLGNLIPIAWAAYFMGEINRLAETNGSVKQLDEVLADLKAKADDYPMLAVMVGDTKGALATLGKNNNEPGLTQRVFGEFIALGENSENPILKQAGELLRGILKVDELVGSPLVFEGIVAGGDSAGKRLATAELNGKYWVLDPWSSSDQTYFETIEELKEIYSEFSPQGMEIVGVNLDENTGILDRVLEVFAMPWPVISQKLSADASLLLPEVVAALPPGSRVLVGPDGNVILVTEDLGTLRNTLAEKLADAKEKAPAAPSTEKPAAPAAKPAAAPRTAPAPARRR